MELRWLWHWLVIPTEVDRSPTICRDVSSRYAGAIQLSAHTSRPACPQPEECDASHRYVAGCRSLRFGDCPTMGTLSLNLYPVYVRGQAYLAAHRGAEAAAEFKKILDQRGAVSNGLIGALAHLGLGRAHAVDRRHRQIPRSLSGFLCSLENADPGISASLKPGLNTRD